MSVSGRSAALKILFLVIVYLVHGRPFVGPVDYGYALLAAYLIVYGHMRNRLKPGLIVLGLGSLLLAHFVPQLAIPEQQRILLDAQQNSISPSQLLKDSSQYLFFLTADGYIQGFQDKRMVSTIDIDEGIVSLRSGWINRREYNFYNPVSPRIRNYLPFVVCYKITPQMEGMRLNLKGLVAVDSDPSLKIDTIQKHHVGATICGFGGKWDEAGIHGLRMNLEKTSLYKFYDVAHTLCLFGGLIVFFFGLFSIPRTREFTLESFLLWLSTISFYLSYPNVFRWGNLAIGGSDGIVHGGFPYWMLEKWAKGDWWQALMSPESVFYYMPGMRYVRFTELLLFGDAYILQISLLLFVPVIFYRFFRVFLSQMTSFLLSLLTFLYLFNGLGLSLKLYHKTMLDLYGEGFAYALLFISLTMLIKSIQTVSKGTVAFFLALVALTIRPNLGVFVGIICAIHLFSTTFSPLPWTSRFMMLFGLAPGILIPIHNILGGEFILLTKASQIPENLPLSPRHYLQAFCHIFGTQEANDCISRLALHFKKIYPHYILAWFGCIWVSIKGKLPIERSLALATFGGLSVHFFYLPHIRYIHPYMTIAVVLGLFQIHKLRAPSSYISSS